MDHPPRESNRTVSTVLAATIVLASAAAVVAGVVADPAFNLVKPSTTGLPGAECRLMSFDADGNLWVAGRWPFWGEAGLARLSADQLPYEPRPGGGFITGNWEVWSSVDHPLPSPYISDWEICPDGVIWIASEGGLTRFDPLAASPETMWKTYDASNAPLLHNGVRSIDMDDAGGIWLTNTIVTSSNGALFHFEPEKEIWTQYTVGKQLPWSPPWYSLNAVKVGSDGRVYVTHSVLTGFAEYDGETWTLHDTTAQFGGMLEDWDGNLWLVGGVSGAGIARWDGTSFTHWPILGGTQTATGLGLGIDGTVYAMSWYGDVFRMVDDTPQFFLNAADIPRGFVQRPNGDIWINNFGGNGTLGTVRHYTSSGQLLERINSFNSGLPDYFIDNIQKDPEGNMWFACGEGGLSRWDGTFWRNWGNHNDLSEPYPFAGNEPMYSMHQDDEGYVWMGGNGIAKWDPEADQMVGFWNWQNSNLGVDSFVAIAEDGNGDIWIGSDYTGAYRYNPEIDDWEWHGFGSSNSVLDMERDLDGNLWVVTAAELHFFNGTTWFGVGPVHGSPVQGPRHLEVHPDGSIWIGASNGLIRYQNGSWTVYDESNTPLPATTVHGLDIRDDGLIGVSVAEFGPVTPFPNGAALFDGETWTIFTYEDHPLPHYQLGDVEFDADGDLWVSTTSEGVVEIVLHESPRVVGDLDGDGDVDAADLAALLAAWGSCGGCAADLDGDGVIGPSDLAILLAAWG